MVGDCDRQAARFESWPVHSPETGQVWKLVERMAECCRRRELVELGKRAFGKTAIRMWQSGCVAKTPGPEEGG